MKYIQFILIMILSLSIVNASSVCLGDDINYKNVVQYFNSAKIKENGKVVKEYRSDIRLNLSREWLKEGSAAQANNNLIAEEFICDTTFASCWFSATIKENSFKDADIYLSLNPDYKNIYSRVYFYNTLNKYCWWQFNGAYTGKLSIVNSQCNDDSDKIFSEVNKIQFVFTQDKPYEVTQNFVDDMKFDFDNEVFHYVAMTPDTNITVEINDLQVMSYDVKECDINSSSTYFNKINDFTEDKKTASMVGIIFIVLILLVLIGGGYYFWRNKSK